MPSDADDPTIGLGGDIGDIQRLDGGAQGDIVLERRAGDLAGIEAVGGDRDGIGRRQQGEGAEGDHYHHTGG